MPAILATRFHGHTALSFIASKLSSHRWVASQAYAEPVGPNLFGKGPADSTLLSPDRTHSRMNSLPPESTLAVQHRIPRRQPSQADRKSLWEPGLPAILATRFHGDTASSFIASKLSSHRCSRSERRIKPPRSTCAHTPCFPTHSSRLAERIRCRRFSRSAHRRLRR